MNDKNEIVKIEVQESSTPESADENLQRGALRVFESVQVDKQIETAKKYPRSITKFMQEVETTISLSSEIAESCQYAIKRKDKKTGEMKVITGASVRLAEIMACAWGNLRIQVFTTEIGKFIKAMANVIDIERNIAISREVIRRGTDSFGNVYNDDLLVLHANAAMAIAKRNAILDAIPRVYTQAVLEKARSIINGQQQKLPERRKKAFEWFKKYGVDQDELLKWLNVKGIEDVGVEQLELLTGLKTALMDGETTISDEFGNVESDDKNDEKAQEHDKTALIANIREVYNAGGVTEEMLINFLKQNNIVRNIKGLEEADMNTLLRVKKFASSWIKIIKG